MSANVTAPMISLAFNENPLGPSPAVRRAIEAALPRLSAYVGGELAELKHLIAARESVAPDQVLLGEILHLVGLYLSARSGPGGTFLYTEPGYTALVDAVAPLGGCVVGIPLAADLGNDFEAFDRLVDANTRAVYLVNPHNPTGIVADRTAFPEFVQRLSKRTLVIVDEAYLDFLDDCDQRSAAALVGAGARVIVFRTFAKLHGLAGLAFGYALAPHDIAHDLHRLGIDAFPAVNRLAVAAAIASLEDAAHLEIVRSQVTAERERWHDLLRRLGARFTDSRGNFVFFNAGRQHADFAAAMASHGVDVGRSHPPLDRWVRISIGTPEQNHVARAAVTALLEGPR